MWYPLVDWGVDTWTATLPMRPWGLASSGVGGHAVAASGIAEAYAIRQDRLVTWTLRLEEHEVEQALEWLESLRGEPREISIRFDADDIGTEYSAWLHAPVWPEDVTPRRDDQFPRVWLLDVTWRLDTPVQTEWGEDE